MPNFLPNFLEIYISEGPKFNLRGRKFLRGPNYQISEGTKFLMGPNFGGDTITKFMRVQNCQIYEGQILYLKDKFRRDQLSVSKDKILEEANFSTKLIREPNFWGPNLQRT